MAEATDRPHGSESVPSNASPAEDRIATPSQFPAAPRGDLGTLAPPAKETYRPLSLLALAGFGLAAVYALVVLGGAAVALFGHIPWLMPLWTFLLPLAAVVLCWAARMRIRDSEETLSGLAFTTWGLRLAVVVSVTYAAYYGATFFAVRGQAIACADSFFAYLQQGQKEQAFLLSLETPVKDLDSTEARNMLESRYNTPPPAPGAVGDLSRFRQSRIVRFIEMGGTETKIALQGVSEWDYSKGGYRVVLRYHIATPMTEFDMNLETFGRDSKRGETKGRQWQVMLPQSDTAISPGSLKMTPYGKEVTERIRKAEQFATSWVEKINQGQWKKASVDTLPPSERSARFADKLVEAEKNLESGKLIRLEDNRFWAGKQQRADIIQRIQKTFQFPFLGRPTFNAILSSTLPLVRESEGRTTVFLDVNFSYLDEKMAKPQYLVQAQLVVASKTAEAASSPSAWQVEALDIKSGRTPPAERSKR